MTVFQDLESAVVSVDLFCVMSCSAVCPPTLPAQAGWRCCLFLAENLRGEGTVAAASQEIKVSGNAGNVMKELLVKLWPFSNQYPHTDRLRRYPNWTMRAMRGVL